MEILTVVHAFEGLGRTLHAVKNKIPISLVIDNLFILVILPHVNLESLQIGLKSNAVSYSGIEYHLGIIHTFKCIIESRNERLPVYHIKKYVSSGMVC